MKYKNTLVPVTNLLVSHQGVHESLCNTCGSIDCTNQIENKQVSILGINRTMRLQCRGVSYYYVVACEGYIEEDIDLPDIDDVQDDNLPVNDDDFDED